jgi:hypothetical protein
VSGQPQDPGTPPLGADEEQLRAAYEEQLSRITISDMMVQATVTLLNLAARELPAPGSGQPPAAGGGDLEQARDAIDAAGALLGIIERRLPREVRPLRDALSQLQLAYATAAGGAAAQAPAAEGAGTAAAAAAGEAAGEGGEGGAGVESGEAAGQERGERGPGPAESSGRLWVPGR